MSNPKPMLSDIQERMEYLERIADGRLNTFDTKISEILNFLQQDVQDALSAVNLSSYAVQPDTVDKTSSYSDVVTKLLQAQDPLSAPNVNIPNIQSPNIDIDVTQIRDAINSIDKIDTDVKYDPQKITKSISDWDRILFDPDGKDVDLPSVPSTDELRKSDNYSVDTSNFDKIISDIDNYISKLDSVIDDLSYTNIDFTSIKNELESIVSDIKQNLSNISVDISEFLSKLQSLKNIKFDQPQTISFEPIPTISGIDVNLDSLKNIKDFTLDAPSINFSSVDLDDKDIPSLDIDLDDIPVKSITSIPNIDFSDLDSFSANGLSKDIDIPFSGIKPPNIDDISFNKSQLSTDFTQVDKVTVNFNSDIQDPNINPPRHLSYITPDVNIPTINIDVDTSYSSSPISGDFSISNPPSIDINTDLIPNKIDVPDIDIDFPQPDFSDNVISIDDLNAIDVDTFVTDKISELQTFVDNLGLNPQTIQQTINNLFDKLIRELDKFIIVMTSLHKRVLQTRNHTFFALREDSGFFLPTGVINAEARKMAMELDEKFIQAYIEEIKEVRNIFVDLTKFNQELNLRVLSELRELTTTFSNLLTQFLDAKVKIKELMVLVYKTKQEVFISYNKTKADILLDLKKLEADINKYSAQLEFDAKRIIEELSAQVKLKQTELVLEANKINAQLAFEAEKFSKDIDFQVAKNDSMLKLEYEKLKSSINLDASKMNIDVSFKLAELETLYKKAVDEINAQIAIKQAELELERSKAEATLSFEASKRNAELGLEVNRINAQLDHERSKANAEIELDANKFKTELEFRQNVEMAKLETEVAKYNKEAETNVAIKQAELELTSLIEGQKIRVDALRTRYELELKKLIEIAEIEKINAQLDVEISKTNASLSLEAKKTFTELSMLLKKYSLDKLLGVYSENFSRSFQVTKLLNELNFEVAKINAQNTLQALIKEYEIKSGIAKTISEIELEINKTNASLEFETNRINTTLNSEVQIKNVEKDLKVMELEANLLSDASKIELQGMIDTAKTNAMLQLEKAKIQADILPQSLLRISELDVSAQKSMIDAKASLLNTKTNAVASLMRSKVDVSAQVATIVAQMKQIFTNAIIESVKLDVQIGLSFLEKSVEKAKVLLEIDKLKMQRNAMLVEAGKLETSELSDNIAKYRAEIAKKETEIQLAMAKLNAISKSAEAQIEQARLVTEKFKTEIFHAIETGTAPLKIYAEQMKGIASANEAIANFNRAVSASFSAEMEAYASEVRAEIEKITLNSRLSAMETDLKQRIIQYSEEIKGRLATASIGAITQLIAGALAGIHVSESASVNSNYNDSVSVTYDGGTPTLSPR